MITKICCGQTRIYAEKYHVEPSVTGVGNLIITSICDSIWTGSVHLYPKKCSKISIHIGSIDSVETRSNLCESDEEWTSHFKRAKKFSYKQESVLTRILENLSKALEI
jgi:hypothetical protein